MKISQISGTAIFTGRTTDYNKFAGKSDLKNNSFWHKNSSIEETLDSYHTNKTGKVYFADPMEQVNDTIRDSVDYIVYDNEPEYPNLDAIHKNYFENNRVNYKENFEEIRQYYYRREMGGFADVDEAKYQQWQAANCAGLYDKGGDLRYKKEVAEDEIVKLNNERDSLRAGIENTQKELKNQQTLKSKLDKHISNLEKMSDSYKKMKDFARKNSSNEEELYYVSKLSINNSKDNKTKKISGKKYNCFEGDNSIEKSISELKGAAYRLLLTDETVASEYSQLSKTLKGFKTIQANSGKKIAEMNSYIKSLAEKVANTDSKIAENKSIIANCKTKLAPVFDELKNFYIKQGIKAIK